MKLPHSKGCKCPTCLGVDDTQRFSPDGEIVTPLSIIYIVWNDSKSRSGEWRINTNIGYVSLEEWVKWQLIPI